MQEVRLLRWQASHRYGCKRKEESGLTHSVASQSRNASVCSGLPFKQVLRARFPGIVGKKGREYIFCLFILFGIILYYISCHVQAEISRGGTI
jgi:hypothetical protein